jgi:hypothetical protein
MSTDGYISKHTGDLVKDCMIELIDILKNGCTQYAEADGNDSHEHDLFDSMDMDRLDLLDKIIRSGTHNQ